MKAYNKFSVLIILSLLSFAAFAQQTENILISPKGDTVILKPIPLLEINAKIGDYNANTKQYKEELKTLDEIYEIDTSALKAKVYLENEKEKITKNFDKLTLVKIENARREWRGYENTLVGWQTTITNRVAELDITLFNVQVEKQTWELTKKTAKELDIPKESVTRISEVISSSKELLKALKSKQDSIIFIQNKITDFQIMVNGVLDTLEEYRKELQSEYFTQDSPAIWHAGDSTMNFKNAKDQFATSLKEQTKSIELFADNNLSNIYLHIIIFIFLLVLFYYLNIDYNKHDIPENSNTIRIKYFLLRYFLSSFLLTLILSLLIYSNIPSAIRELMAILLLIPTILLYSAILPKSFRKLLFYVVILFLIGELHIFFTAKTLFTRVLMMIQDGLYIWIMFHLIKIKNPIGYVSKEGWLKVIASTANFLAIIAIASIVCNIIGYVNLSIIISNTLVTALIVPIILSLLVYILMALFTSLFKTKFFQHSNIIKSNEEKIISKLYTLLIYFSIFLWIRSILVALGLAEEVGNWLLGVMNNEWKVGSVNTSFGGIIAFFLVILITSIVTKGLKYLLEDEIFPRIKLGRGVPGAISMVVRYTLVAFGIYIALSAAGIDLGQFGLIAGALGVGIGFGLQSVVFNFIAGLILAFERPIQKGDTIEIGTLIGDVMSIGVRASTIRTYDGADVIVPNGNLISNDLINWTFSDRVKRREIKVGVAYGTNPHQVMELLVKVASENEHVLPFPKPWPLFEGFGDSSLKFQIRFWVNFDQGMTVKSQVAMNIYDALADAGIQIPFPQTDLHVKSFDPTIQKTIFPFSKEQIKKTPGRKPGKPKKQEDTE